MRRGIPSGGLCLASESRSTQAAAQQLGSRSRLRHCWQQAQLVAEAGREEVARGPAVRALRARLKRAWQARDMFKKAWVTFGQPGAW